MKARDESDKTDTAESTVVVSVASHQRSVQRVTYLQTCMQIHTHTHARTHAHTHIVITAPSRKQIRIRRLPGGSIRRSKNIFLKLAIKSDDQKPLH